MMEREMEMGKWDHRTEIRTGKSMDGILRSSMVGDYGEERRKEIK